MALTPVSWVRSARQKSYATLNCDAHLVICLSDSCKIGADMEGDVFEDLEHQVFEQSELSTQCVGLCTLENQEKIGEEGNTWGKGTATTLQIWPTMTIDEHQSCVYAWSNVQ